MQKYLDKLNSVFNQLLKNHRNQQLWGEFNKIINECCENDIGFYYNVSYIVNNKTHLILTSSASAIKDNAQMLRIKKEMKKLEQEKIKAVKMQFFHNAIKLYEQDKELQKQLDRETAKAFYKTENYFYKVEARPQSCIGFNFTSNKVIDFLMEYYSKNRYGDTKLF